MARRSKRNNVVVSTSDEAADAIINSSVFTSLRVAGATYEEIANKYETTPRFVKDSLIKTLEEKPYDNIENLRTLELSRLDFMQKKLWPKVLDGNEKAIKTCIKIIDMRAKISGLYTPIQIDINPTMEDFDQVLNNYYRAYEENKQPAGIEQVSEGTEVLTWKE